MCLFKQRHSLLFAWFYLHVCPSNLAFHLTWHPRWLPRLPTWMGRPCWEAGNVCSTTRLVLQVKFQEGDIAVKASPGPRSTEEMAREVRKRDMCNLDLPSRAPGLSALKSNLPARKAPRTMAITRSSGAHAGARTKDMLLPTSQPEA